VCLSSNPGGGFSLLAERCSGKSQMSVREQPRCPLTDCSKLMCAQRVHQHTLCYM
jgi:hypothetical protein